MSQFSRTIRYEDFTYFYFGASAETGCRLPAQNRNVRTALAS
jgi:hypothetical protein